MGVRIAFGTARGDGVLAIRCVRAPRCLPDWVAAPASLPGLGGLWVPWTDFLGALFAGGLPLA